MNGIRGLDGVLGIAVDFLLNDSDDDEGPPARRMRFIRERISHFEDLDDKDFTTRFRFSKASTFYVLTLIDHKLEFPTDK